MDNKGSLAKLMHHMFQRGLGDLILMRSTGQNVMLGNLVMEKGELLLKDRGLLVNTAYTSVASCWEIGIIGAVCDLRGNDWESLTYLGPDHCHIPVDLSATRHKLLCSIVNVAGEDLITYQGSVYRGFKVLLDANLLPIVLPVPIKTRLGVVGLAVSDFRYATVPLETLLRVNDAVRTSVERHTSLTVEDFDVSEEEFGSLFGGYLKE